MTDFNIGLTNYVQPVYRPQAAAPAATGPIASYANDQLAIAGGAAPGMDPASIQAALSDADPRNRFQAVINATKLPPAQAIPLLQQAAGNDNPQVVQLAQRALAVMQQMPGAPQTQPQYNPQQPQGQQLPYQPYQPPAAAPYTAANMGTMNPQDAAMMFNTLQDDLKKPGQVGIDAVKQLAGLVQVNPQLKDSVVNLLLNKVYDMKLDPSVEPEAIRALGSFHDPRVNQYLAAMLRAPGRTNDSRAACEDVLRSSMSGPTTAGANGQPQVTVEWLRLEEQKLNKVSPQQALAIFAELRSALGPDARAQSPNRNEVLRILLSYIATPHDNEGVTAACQILGEMKTRDMDSLRYLDALTRATGVMDSTKAAAKAAMRSIMSP
ncbi:MAG: hypothetical protein JWM80_1085 [Cyanobacteria bacterium RYN_339]|nr:hypothetical protein [Cyanobacteria bacterium RYN_339]